MALTLAEAKVGMRNHIDAQVIDTFRRSSLLLDLLTFDDSLSPGAAGSTLVYGYQRLTTPSTAAVRAINNEYTANEAKRTEYTASPVIFGGSFQLDRVIIDTAGMVDELDYQLEQKIRAAVSYFHYLAINGQAASSGSGYVNGTFDGLKKMVAGTSTDIASTVALTDASDLAGNSDAFIDELDAFLTELNGADILLMNGKMLSKVRSAARRAGYYSRTEDAFGRPVENYNGIALMDAGKYWNGSAEVDCVATSAATASAEAKTDIYAVKLGLDAFHGISVDGSKMIHTYLPDLTAPGAVKTGEVEMIAGVVLKNSRCAGRLKDIKIGPKTS